MTFLGAKSELDSGSLLLERGCRQGAVIEQPARLLWLAARGGSSAELVVGDETVPDARLVVASQDCDIKAASEPRVEALMARWTEDARETYAARKRNSARLFALVDEGTRVLVADARHRVHIDKRALHGARFSRVLAEGISRDRFARWLGGRYDRPAIPDALVAAINKPIVRDVGSLLKKKSSPLSGLLTDKVEELRFRVRRDSPLSLDLVVMVADRQLLSAEDEAELNAWLEGTLVAGDGAVNEILVAYRDERSISLHEYLSTVGIPLDYYSE